jgi:hypothetical protein
MLVKWTHGSITVCTVFSLLKMLKNAFENILSASQFKLDQSSGYNSCTNVNRCTATEKGDYQIKTEFI